MIGTAFIGKTATATTKNLSSAKVTYESKCFDHTLLPSSNYVMAKSL